MSDDTTKDLRGTIQVDEGQLQGHVDEVVRTSVEETLNTMLEAEADQISYRPLRGRYDEGPSKGPSVSQVPASPVSSRLLPASGCNRG